MRTTRTRRLSLAGLTLAAAVTLGACGGAAGSDVPPAAPAAAPAADLPALVATDVATLGTVVTDKSGFTLYRFDKDKPRPSTSNCAGDCAAKWPPVTVDPQGQLSLTGVEQSAIGVITRTDGTSQLTVGGWPVYRFAGDAAAGEAKGQGVGGTWFAVTPQGKKAPAAG